MYLSKLGSTGYCCEQSKGTILFTVSIKMFHKLTCTFYWTVHIVHNCSHLQIWFQFFKRKLTVEIQKRRNDDFKKNVYLGVIVMNIFQKIRAFCAKVLNVQKILKHGFDFFRKLTTIFFLMSKIVLVGNSEARLSYAAKRNRTKFQLIFSQVSLYEYVPTYLAHVLQLLQPIIQARGNNRVLAT